MTSNDPTTTLKTRMVKREEKTNKRKKKREAPRKRAIMVGIQRHKIELNSNNRRVIKSEGPRRFS